MHVFGLERKSKHLEKSRMGRAWKRHNIPQNESKLASFFFCEATLLCPSLHPHVIHLCCVLKCLAPRVLSNLIVLTCRQTCNKTGKSDFWLVLWCQRCCYRGCVLPLFVCMLALDDTHGCVSCARYFKRSRAQKPSMMMVYTSLHPAI